MWYPFHMRTSGLDTTVVLTPSPTGLPYISYWGPSLYHSTAIHIDEDLLASQYPQRLGAALDIPEFPSLLPTQAEAWSGTPMLSVARNNCEVFPKFAAAQISLSECGTKATVSTQDTVSQLELTLTIEVHPGGAVSQQASLTNNGPDLEVKRLWLTFPVPSSANEILSHTGHHLRERAPQRHPLVDGFYAQESWTGRPDFHSSLLMVAGTAGFTFETGRCYSTHVGWSGNVTHFVTRTPYSAPLIGGGELLYNGEITLSTGQTYTTPYIYASWGDGLNQLSHRYHDLLRTFHSRLLSQKRPITLNIWEAVYFDQNEAKLRKLAEVAAAAGVERFVVDDGWFKGRRDDTRALGDWQVDNSIWPNGLAPLANHVHQLGMQFGLWFEPEMISLRSDLAQQHPDWILQPTPGLTGDMARLPLPGRSQQVLDLANPLAAEYIFEAISRLVTECHIDYLKWDHNRFVTEAISAFLGRPAVHAQVCALYELLDRLQMAHPSLEIESCSSGGGRVDLGILSRTQRIWTSDCTDPIERIEIQQQTSLLVPPEMQGAHVASSPSHITRRHSTVDTRVAAAFLEHFGIEWNLLDVPEGDLSALRDWIALLKGWRDKTGTARLWHASLADPALRLDGLVTADQKEAIFRFSVLETSARYPFDLVRLPGLSPEADYLVRPLGELNRLAMMSNPSTHGISLPWWNPEGTVISGQVLAQWGLRLPALDPGSIVLISVEQVIPYK